MLAKKNEIFFKWMEHAMITQNNGKIEVIWSLRMPVWSLSLIKFPMHSTILSETEYLNDGFHG